MHDILFLHGFHSLPEYIGVFGAGKPHTFLLKQRQDRNWLCPSFAWRHKERRMRHRKKKTLQIRRWREREEEVGVRAQRQTAAPTLRMEKKGDKKAQFQPWPGPTWAEPCRAAASGLWSAPAPGRRSSPWGWPAWSAASPAGWRMRSRRPSPRCFLMPRTWEDHTNNYCIE